MTSIALLYTTATSSKANTTRVFEEEAWSGQLNLSVNVWSERLWFQHYPRIIPFSVKGVDGGDAWRPRTVNGSVFATQSVAFGLDFDSLAHEIKKRKHVTKSEYSLWPSSSSTSRFQCYHLRAFQFAMFWRMLLGVLCHDAIPDTMGQLEFWRLISQKRKQGWISLSD